MFLYTFCEVDTDSHSLFSTQNTGYHEGDKYSPDNHEAEAVEAIRVTDAENVTAIHQHYHTEANQRYPRGRHRRRHRRNG